MNLNELYQEVILDHGRKPRNFRLLPMATHTAEGHNPLCGDQIHLMLSVKDGVIQEATFDGCGCAISTASASLMTEAIKGQKIEDAEILFRQFQEAIVANGDTEPLGVLECLIGVKEYPTRVKCATLAWHALRAALESDEKSVTISTETGEVIPHA